MILTIKNNYEEISKWVASRICDAIISHKYPSNPLVLGLPTGGSIEGSYSHIVKAFTKGKISFKNVVTFNMDEYRGLAPDHPQSYSHFMYTHLFDHIDIPSENINLLDGQTNDVASTTRAYEEKIKSYGGIDLFIGGMGENGHIAFNEPYSSLNSYTREKTLDESTIVANSRYFDSADKVPKSALTVGIQTIMNAHKVIFIAHGKKKASALQMALEGSISHLQPVTMLQLHSHANIICDEAACEELKVKTYKYFKTLDSMHS